MKKILLAGNSVTANIIAGYLRSDLRYEIKACVVDDEFVSDGGVESLRSLALSHLPAIYPADQISVIMAMGYSDLNRGREKMYNKLREMGYVVETYIHPDAKVYSENPIGEGSVVLPGAVIEPYAKIGADTLVWCNVTVAHHSSVSDHCWIASGSVIAGYSSIGRNTFMGINSTIINKIEVAEFNLIGAGALITKNTKPNTVHLARSAEPLRYSSNDYVKYFGI